ncbi:MAG: pyridoxal phosphate-dependent aminotransferase [Acidaminococcaceae bacterium]
MSTFDFNAVVSPAIKALPASGLSKFMEITANNPNIIPLSVGEPDFALPHPVRDACINSIKAGQNKYTSTLGMLELREAIADDIFKNYGVQYDPRSEILVSVGVSEALYCAITAITTPGDEIIIPEPCYISNKACIILAGGKPVVVETFIENNFVPTLEALEKAVTPRTRAIMLGYPNNPTGAVISKEEIKMLGDWAVQHNLVIISDELYAHLTYNGKKHTMFTSYTEFKDRTIVLNGFSKAYAMTGLRLGYMMAPAAIIDAINLLHQQIILCPNVTAQVGAIAALKYCAQDVKNMVAEYDNRRGIMIEGFKAMELPLYAPEGAFYVFPCIKKTGLSSMDFVEKLLAEEEVLVIPGNIFGASGEGFIRCSYAYSEVTLREALKRIARFITKHTIK